MKGSDLMVRRRKSGLSQEAIALALGVYAHTISDIEADRLGIDEETSRHWSAAIDDLAAMRPQEARIAIAREEASSV